MLYIKNRHEKLINTSWSEEIAYDTINQISKTLINEFRGKDFWPVHPDLKDFLGFVNPITNLWNGATGTIWALDELQRSNMINLTVDFKPYFKDLKAMHPKSMQDLPKNLEIDINTPGYIIGYSSILLLEWKLTKNSAILDELAELIHKNAMNKAREMMFAAPGTMLVAWFLYQETKEERFATLFRESANYLFDNWQYSIEDDCYIWVQDMYKILGDNIQFLGPVHGFAGNVFALIMGFDLLDNKQQQLLIKQSLYTYVNTAHINKSYANWPMYARKDQLNVNEHMLLQLCHGAPGILIAFDKLYPYMNELQKDIFKKGVNLTWDAGPLSKPWGLCHGTAGNGYLFLKYYTITKEPIWLERARKFAMHAIHQSKNMQSQYKALRPDNWCGDLGLALYLKDCIQVKSDFPLLDYF